MGRTRLIDLTAAGEVYLTRGGAEQLLPQCLWKRRAGLDPSWRSIFLSSHPEARERTVFLAKHLAVPKTEGRAGFERTMLRSAKGGKLTEEVEDNPLLHPATDDLTQPIGGPEEAPSEAAKAGGEKSPVVVQVPAPPGADGMGWDTFGVRGMGGVYDPLFDPTANPRFHPDVVFPGGGQGIEGLPPKSVEVVPGQQALHSLGKFVKAVADDIASQSQLQQNLASAREVATAAEFDPLAANPGVLAQWPNPGDTAFIGLGKLDAAPVAAVDGSAAGNSASATGHESSSFLDTSEAIGGAVALGATYKKNAMVWASFLLQP